MWTGFLPWRQGYFVVFNAKDEEMFQLIIKRTVRHVFPYLQTSFLQNLSIPRTLIFVSWARTDIGCISEAEPLSVLSISLVRKENISHRPLSQRSRPCFFGAPVGLYWDLLQRRGISSLKFWIAKSALIMLFGTNYVVFRIRQRTLDWNLSILFDFEAESRGWTS